MDPTETLCALIAAALNRNPEAVRELSEDLARWLSHGGFEPDIQGVVDFLNREY